MIDINELRRLTHAASKGPWRVYEVGVGFEIAAGDNVVAQAQSIPRDSVQHAARRANAAFIAAANPAAISELLDRLEAAEKDVAIKEEVIDSLAAVIKRLDAQCDAAEKAITEAYQRGYATGQEEVAAELEFAKREIANLHDDISEWMDKCDALHAKIERTDRLEKVESALSDLLNDLEERAKWNLEASQRVVACGNGVYVRAKATLEESK